MLFKIISGGQTGVDRAALDAAIDMGLEHGGWVPRGRRSEAGPVPVTYHVQETASEAYAERTEKNVIDSDGTLVISRKKLSGGSRLTRLLAMEHGKPTLHIDLSNIPAFKAAGNINEWVMADKIGVLNVAGPRASQDSGIYEAARNLIKAFLYLYRMKAHAPDKVQEGRLYPKTTEEAVERLIAQMTLKDKIRMARMGQDELASLSGSLGEYIENRFGLRFGNRQLLDSCDGASRRNNPDAESASTVIMLMLWERLRETHMIRRVK